jgi:homoserine dehydrogenase
MRIIIIGFGTVGQAVAKILTEKEAVLLNTYGFRPSIVAVVDRKGAALSPSGLDYNELEKVKKSSGSVSFHPQYGQPEISGIDVINNVESDIIVEATPTKIEDGEPGLSHIEAALKKKKHVITVNKGPLAVALPALMELASYNNVFLRFSGSVGGGTPILDLGKICLRGDRSLSIKGILNGTTNYILTKMTDSNMPMSIALQEAQKAGYAEADPTYDVEGIDAACKLVIMANWLINKPITIKDVEITGIRGITLDDVQKAKKRGEAIKLICTINDEKIEVKPQSISKSHPLCVNGTLNAVTYHMEYAGEITIVGHGAGGIQTADAVLRDLIDIRRRILK